jgi:hypothetical protein
MMANMHLVARTLDGESLDRARDRHRRLVAALAQTLAGNQSALHRKLVQVDPDLALSTVQSWCRGPDAPRGTAPSELTLRSILEVLGLAPDWEPAEPSKKPAKRH